MVKETKLEKEVNELKECLKEKDRRLSHIENIHGTIKVCFVIVFVVLSFAALLISIFIVNSSLPLAVESVSDGGRGLVDLGQLLSTWFIIVLSIIGLIAIWIVFGFSISWLG